MTTPVLAPTAEVVDGPIVVRLDGIGTWVCDEGHVSLADPDVAGRIIAAIGDDLLAARRRRLRREDACGDCGEVLRLRGRDTETPVPLATPFGVVTATLVTPMVRCPSCGREQLPVDVAAALPDLVAGAVGTITTGASA